jgi:aminoglycoside 6'-N-acetyltransferase
MTGSAQSETNVGLRALDLPADWPLLERWLGRPHVVRWWGTDPLLAAELARGSRETDAIITADGEPVGYLCWQTPPASELAAAGLTDLPGNLVDIDILIGEPGILGRGVGPGALALMLARLRDQGVGFAGVGTSTSNRAAIRAFEKAGFRRFRDFEDPEFGPCRYLVAELRGGR